MKKLCVRPRLELQKNEHACALADEESPRNGGEEVVSAVLGSRLTSVAVVLIFVFWAWREGVVYWVVILVPLAGVVASKKGASFHQLFFF